jgi:hypothetical protein
MQEKFKERSRHAGAVVREMPMECENRFIIVCAQESADRFRCLYVPPSSNHRGHPQPRMV